MGRMEKSVPCWKSNNFCMLFLSMYFSVYILFFALLKKFFIHCARIQLYGSFVHVFFRIYSVFCVAQEILHSLCEDTVVWILSPCIFPYIFCFLRCSRNSSFIVRGYSCMDLK